MTHATVDSRRFDIHYPRWAAPEGALRMQADRLGLAFEVIHREGWLRCHLYFKVTGDIRAIETFSGSLERVVELWNSERTGP